MINAPGRRAGISRARSAAALAVFPLCACCMQAAFAGLEVERPRPFGYVVGDELEVVVRTTSREGVPDSSSLPKLGRVSRDLALRSAATDGHTVRLRYQVIGAPDTVTTIDVPGWTLSLPTAAGAAAAQRVEAFPITVSPLTPATPVARDGLEELRPAIEPLYADTLGPRVRLGAYAAVALALSLLYAWSAWGRGWLMPNRAPFARACLELARLEPSDADAGMRALRIAHRALDTRAGRVVMAPDLDAFLAAQPQLAALRDAMQELFRRSGAAFFAAAAPPPDTLAFVRDLCRRAAQCERG